MALGRGAAPRDFRVVKRRDQVRKREVDEADAEVLPPAVVSRAAVAVTVPPSDEPLEREETEEPEQHSQQDRVVPPGRPSPERCGQETKERRAEKGTDGEVDEPRDEVFAKPRSEPDDRHRHPDAMTPDRTLAATMSARIMSSSESYSGSPPHVLHPGAGDA